MSFSNVIKKPNVPPEVWGWSLLSPVGGGDSSRQGLINRHSLHACLVANALPLSAPSPPPPTHKHSLVPSLCQQLLAEVLVDHGGLKAQLLHTIDVVLVLRNLHSKGFKF